MPPSNQAPPSGRHAQALAPSLIICAVGVVFFALAETQPAWIGDRIGPGLFAQWLSLGIVGLSMVWAVVSLVELWLPPRRGETEPTGGLRLRGRAGPGLALLTAVCLFALLLPVAGMIAACAVTAAVAGWGAGDRSLGALGLSALLGAAVAASVGLTLLPPTIRLWPWSPF